MMCTDRFHKLFFFFQAEDGIRDYKVTGVQTCALPICCATSPPNSPTSPTTAWAQAMTCWSRTWRPRASCGKPGTRSAPAPYSGPLAKVHRSEEHTSELQSPCNLVCRLLLEKKKTS